MVPAALSILAATALSWVAVPGQSIHHETGVFTDAVAGIRYVFHNRVLRMLAGTMTIYNMGSGALAIAIPVLVLHRLHGGSKSVGLFFGAMGLAGFVAGMAMGRIGTEHREKGVLALGCACSALGYSALAWTHSPALAGMEIAFCGLANGPLIVAMFSLRQRATDPLWFGRAFSVSMSVNFAGYPIGAAIAGALLAHSIALAFTVAAGLSLLGGVWPTVLPRRFYEPLTVETSRPIVATE